MRRAEIAAAAPAIDRAAALRPDDPTVVQLRGQIRMNGSDRDGAQTDATWMLAHGRTAAQLEQTAVLLVRLGRAHDALAAAARVVELTSGSPAAYGNLAVLAMQVREPAAAERALHDGRARHPDDIELAQTHAAFLLATHRPAQAREIYASLLPRHPQPGIIHQALALLAHEAGDLDAAQRHADAAVQALGDSRASVHYTRVVVLHDRGEREAAAQALERARRRFPADEDLQRLQAELVGASGP
jgi:predicted Zn-dependent protease